VAAPKNGDHAFIWVHEKDDGWGLSAEVTLTGIPEAEPGSGVNARKIRFVAQNVSLTERLDLREIKSPVGIFKLLDDFRHDSVTELYDEDLKEVQRQLDIKRQRFLQARATSDVPQTLTGAENQEQASQLSQRKLPPSITNSDVLAAISDIDSGVEHGFAESVDYDLTFGGRRYAPKAVAALAARRVTGLTYRPSDFRGGEGTKCFQLLTGAGFVIIPKASGPTYPEELEDKEYVEGAKKTVTVNAYERDIQARADCIARYGYACKVCDFDFGAVYGPLGDGFIHVHHLVPLHKIKQEYKVNPEKDLRPVCPNCHAMLHRGREPLTIEQLRNLLGKQTVA